MAFEDLKPKSKGPDLVSMVHTHDAKLSLIARRTLNKLKSIGPPDDFFINSRLACLTNAFSEVEAAYRDLLVNIGQIKD